MQSKTAQEFKTVYEQSTEDNDVIFNGLSNDYFPIYDSMQRHYACGDILRLDARVHMDTPAVFRMNYMDMEAIYDAIKKLCKLDQITKIEMRLNTQEFDRWIPVPKYMSLIRVHGLDCFGIRCGNSFQNDTAQYRAMNLAARSGTRPVVTHIYIPSTENREIPIYPCEPFGVKKVDLKS